MMSHETESILDALRRQAWERAKGELGALLNTYFDQDQRFEAVSLRVKTFIKEFEDNW